MFTFKVKERTRVYRHVFLALTLNPQTLNENTSTREWHNMPLPNVSLTAENRIRIQIPEPLEEVMVSMEDGVVRQTCVPKWYLTTLLVDQGEHGQCPCGNWRIRFKKCPDCALEFCSSGCDAYRTHWLETHHCNDCVNPKVDEGGASAEVKL